MKFMNKNLEDLIVTLPFADGTELDCGVYASFEINGNTYFALLPLLEERKMDFSQSYMLYRVIEDEDGNPVVVYIEDDYEYALAARHFSDHFLNQLN